MELFQRAGLGQGLGLQQALQQWMQNRGGAFGRRGQGAGGKAPISPTPTGRKMVKVPTKTTPGDIIARQFIDGPQIVGESTAQFRQVAAAVKEGYDEAQSEDQLPRKYSDTHKHYFGELARQVEVVMNEAETETEGEGDAGEEAPAPPDEGAGDG